MKKTKWGFNWKETRKNKICSILLAIVAILSMFIDGDGTSGLFLLVFAVPLFFETENFIK